MPFEIDEQVVCPAYDGVGRIVGLAMKQFMEPEARLYYEITVGKSTVWMLAEAANNANGLRPITPKASLAYYRDVLRSRPEPLTMDSRQRRLDLLNRLRVGSFQDVCEVVRDLSARGWQRPSGEVDSALLRKTRDALCQEWMISEGISMQNAISEVNALLVEARQAHSPKPETGPAKSQTRLPHRRQ